MHEQSLEPVEQTTVPFLVAKTARPKTTREVPAIRTHRKNLATILRHV